MQLFVSKLEFPALIGCDIWNKNKHSPIRLSLKASLDATLAAQNDHFALTTSYAALAETAQQFLQSKSHSDSLEAARIVADLILQTWPQITEIQIDLQKPKSILFAESAGALVTRTRLGNPQHSVLATDKKILENSDLHLPTQQSAQAQKSDCISITALQISGIIGIYPCERIHHQPIVITLRIWDLKTPNIVPKSITANITKFVEKSSFQTLEALADGICNLILGSFICGECHILVSKPCAIPFANCAGVELQKSAQTHGNPALASCHVEAYISVGSNLGNRILNIQNSINEMKKFAKITNTSFIYQSEPMYLEAQPQFLNACIQIETQLSEQSLLEALKLIEVDTGRDLSNGAVRNGPRLIDLDIIYYNGSMYKSEILEIPHKSMQERQFVLAPLNE